MRISIPSTQKIGSRHLKKGSRTRAFIFSAGVFLLTLPPITGAQQPTKIPESVMTLAGKYDETRKNTLGPIIDALAQELKTKTVPGLTRAGKADIAIQIELAAGALTRFATPVLPREGAPFSREALTAVQETQEWKAFADKFTQMESALNESYQKALDREKAKFQTAGDPHGVLAVESESKRVDALAQGLENPLSAAPSSKPAMTNPPVLGSDSTGSKARISSEDKKRIESYFVGKTWATVQVDGELYYFGENGRGAKKNHDVVTNSLNWRIEDDGTVFVNSAGYDKHITFLSGLEGTMVVHAGPPKGDVHQTLTATSEKIPGVE